jgi:hypothetical protein
MALGLLVQGIGMSRSFVRAWATVATLMALVCFAFVQPMPEHTATPRVHQQAAGTEDLAQAPSAHLMVSPPFVDTVMTGKTFTPYLVVSSPPLLVGADGLGVPIAVALADVSAPPIEPPTRPG